MIITEEVIDRLVGMEVANLASRLEPASRREGNPSGIHLRRFGRAVAFLSTKLSLRFYNSVLGVGPEVLDDLETIRAFYREHDRKCALEIAPGRLTEPMALELAARGFAMVEYHVGLARRLSPKDVSSFRAPEGVTIEEIDRNDTAKLDQFIDAYLEGWGMESAELEEGRLNMRAARGNREWRYYLAFCDGQPAGTAILDVRGPTAMLGSASTRAAFRGRRVQAALIDRRIDDAAASGCDLLIGSANYGTSSMRNQQRAGLVTACTKGIWVER
jgi:hypothetical protein